MKNEKISPFQWVLIIAAGVVVGNIIFSLSNFAINSIIEHNGSKICNEEIRIDSQTSTPGDCYSECDGECSSLGYSGGTFTNTPVIGPNSINSTMACECQCKGCRTG